MDPVSESDGQLLARLGTDAQLWAREFIRLHGYSFIKDEGLMISWFANAIEAGRSAGWQAGLDSERGSGLP